MAWIETSEESLFKSGVKRLTLAPPLGYVPVPPAAGYTFTIPFIDLTYTLQEYSYDPKAGKIYIVLKVEEGKRLDVRSNDLINNNLAYVQAAPTPSRRLVSGYVKETAAVPSIPQDAQAAVIAIPYLIGAIAVLVGLGALYLVLSKVEDLVESPAIGLPLIAGSLLVLWVLWGVFKAKLKGAIA